MNLSDLMVSESKGEGVQRWRYLDSTKHIFCRFNRVGTLAERSEALDARMIINGLL